MKWKNRLIELLRPTKICKNCFCDINELSFHYLINEKFYLCNKCIKEMNPLFLNFNFEGCNGLALYEYNSSLKKMIYLLKGCSDYEIRETLILPYKEELKLLYKDFIFVPVPSHIERIKERGFNHVIALFECLNLEICDCLYKKENINQHLLNSEERKKIKKIIEIRRVFDLKQKKILIVDDIMTTGETLKRCIDLLKQEHPKKIKILVLSKRLLSKNELNH